MNITFTDLAERDLKSAIFFAQQKLPADATLIEERASDDAETFYLRSADANGAGFRIAQVTKDGMSFVGRYTVTIQTGRAVGVVQALIAGLAGQI